MSGWYTRSVFFVSDLTATHRFFIDDLEFQEAWICEEDGRSIVAQVNRDDCEIILAIDPDRAGKSRLFIELEAHELTAFRALIKTKQIPARDGWWGYPVIEIRDPDGNELLFPMDESP